MGWRNIHYYQIYQNHFSESDRQSLNITLGFKKYNLLKTFISTCNKYYYLVEQILFVDNIYLNMHSLSINHWLDKYSFPNLLKALLWVRQAVIKYYSVQFEKYTSWCPQGLIISMVQLSRFFNEYSMTDQTKHWSLSVKLTMGQLSTVLG